MHPLAAYNDYLRDDFNCIMAGEDKEAVVQRVKAAFDSYKARELLVAAQQTIREKYSVEHIGPQLEALLRETYDRRIDLDHVGRDSVRPKRHRERADPQADL